MAFCWIFSFVESVSNVHCLNEVVPYVNSKYLKEKSACKWCRIILSFASLSKPETCLSHLIISTTHCPVKSTRAIMEGGKKEEKTHTTSTSYQLDTVGVLFCSQTTARMCLSGPHKHLNIHQPPTPLHTFTVCFKVRFLTTAASHDLPVKKKKKGDCGKKVLVCEASGINASGLALNTHYFRCCNQEVKDK